MKAEISEGLHRDRHIVVPCGGYAYAKRRALGMKDTMPPTRYL